MSSRGMKNMITKAETIRTVLFAILFLLAGFALGEDDKSNRSLENKDAVSSASNGSQTTLPQSSDILLHEMDPSKFIEMERVGSKIDLSDIDHALLSAAIFHETNQRREKQGKKRLDYLPRLDEASRMHASSMAEHEYVAHANPRKEALRTPADRVRNVGLENLRYVSENVATHFGIQYEPGKPVIPMKQNGETEFFYELGGESIENHTYRSFAENLLDQWMESPGHRKNILAEQPDFLGAGCSINREEKMDKFYCVQLFFDRFGS